MVCGDKTPTEAGHSFKSTKTLVETGNSAVTWPVTMVTAKWENVHWMIPYMAHLITLHLYIFIVLEYIIYTCNTLKRKLLTWCDVRCVHESCAWSLEYILELTLTRSRRRVRGGHARPIAAPVANKQPLCTTVVWYSWLRTNENN